MIAESVLLPYGKLNTTITDHDDNTNVNKRVLGHTEFNINDPGVKNGINYHTLTYEHRAINLDTVTAPTGKIVTGIRFHVTDKSVLTIQIRATDFNYETGRRQKRIRVMFE